MEIFRKSQSGRILVLILLSVHLLSGVVTGSDHLKDRLKEIQSSLAEAKRKYLEKSKQEEKLLAELRKINREISEVTGTLDVLEKNLQRLVAKRRLYLYFTVQLQDEIERRKTYMAEKVRAFSYRTEEPLSLFFSGEGELDYFDQLEMYERIFQYDAAMLASMRTLMEDLDRRRMENEKSFAEIREASRKVEQEYRVLNAKESRRKRELARIRKDKRYYYLAVKTLEEDEKYLEKIINLLKNKYSLKNEWDWVFVWPTKEQTITSYYGMRYHPILRRKRFHSGIDIRGKTGTPVYAAASGVVVQAERLRGYGNTVIIIHSTSPYVATLYAHLSRIYVKPGDEVTAGAVIGAVGATGLATGPHLHFEVRLEGKPVNPLYFYYVDYTKNRKYVRYKPKARVKR